MEQTARALVKFGVTCVDRACPPANTIWLPRYASLRAQSHEGESSHLTATLNVDSISKQHYGPRTTTFSACHHGKCHFGRGLAQC